MFGVSAVDLETNYYAHLQKAKLPDVLPKAV